MIVRILVEVLLPALLFAAGVYVIAQAATGVPHRKADSGTLGPAGIAFLAALAVLTLVAFR